jgi:hypothetical protein
MNSLVGRDDIHILPGRLMALKIPNLAQYHFPYRSLLLAAMAPRDIPNEAVCLEA